MSTVFVKLLVEIYSSCSSRSAGDMRYPHLIPSSLIACRSPISKYSSRFYLQRCNSTTHSLLYFIFLWSPDLCVATLFSGAFLGKSSDVSTFISAPESFTYRAAQFISLLSDDPLGTFAFFPPSFPLFSPRVFSHFSFFPACFAPSPGFGSGPDIEIHWRASWWRALSKFC